MATRIDVFQILSTMDDAEFEAFKQKFGGDHIRRQYADLLITKPAVEARLCEVVGLKTEQQKQ